MELQCLLDIITILNDENKTKEDRFNNCYEFVDYFNNKLHKHGRK